MESGRFQRIPIGPKILLVNYTVRKRSLFENKITKVKKGF